MSTITYGDRAHARETPYVIVRVSIVTLCDTEHALCITRTSSISHIAAEGKEQHSALGISVFDGFAIWDVAYDMEHAWHALTVILTMLDIHLW